MVVKKGGLELTDRRIAILETFFRDATLAAEEAQGDRPEELGVQLKIRRRAKYCSPKCRQ